MKDEPEKRFKVVLTQECEDDTLDSEDINEFGEHGKGGVAYEWTIMAEDEDKAIDLFHLNVPISLLENYSWEAEEIEGEEEPVTCNRCGRARDGYEPFLSYFGKFYCENCWDKPKVKL
jgi:hypothetical protein